MSVAAFGRLSHCHGHACTISVSNVIGPGRYLLPDEALAARRMFDYECPNVQYVPVIDRDAKPLGILSAHDVLQALSTEVDDEEELLRDYVMSYGYH